ncbi:hypothetical protein HJG60_007974 [Phyllostomus discolor]|uniref:Uncharacterized protein n=1 Tax=Phyllostomus discolor TaxID=89673 RepID=A0A834BE75_9CHIR|nr:hypothetical protein HJG60_007974 [Phyllostomus discolor]
MWGWGREWGREGTMAVVPFSWDLRPFSGILGCKLCPGPQSPPHWVRQLQLAYSGTTRCVLARWMAVALISYQVFPDPRAPMTRARPARPLLPIWMYGSTSTSWLSDFHSDKSSVSSGCYSVYKLLLF